MKILYLHQWLYAKDGSAIHGTELIRALRNVPDKDGNPTQVIVFPPKSSQNPEVGSLRKAYAKTIELIPTHPLIRQPLRGTRNALFGTPVAEPEEKLHRTVATVKRIIDDESPDVILARLATSTFELMEQVAEWDVPLILEVNAPVFYEATEIFNLTLSEDQRHLEQRLWEVADSIVVVSSGLADILKEHGINEHKIFVVPNGVDPTRFAPSISGDSIRRRHRLQETSVVGHVGSLTQIHDLDTLIDAFKLVLDAHDADLKLLLVGDGPDRGCLMRKIESSGLDEHVILTGHVEYGEVPVYLAAMDIVTVPLLEKNLKYSSPIKLFEYMAMAKPIVGTNAGQIQEILSHGETALLVEPHSPEALSEALLELLRDPQRGTELGGRARDLVCQRYTWEMNAWEIVKICQEITAASRPK